MRSIYRRSERAVRTCIHLANPGRSMATAALDDHVFVLLQYNVAFVEEIQHGDRRELGGRAARLWYLTRANQMHQRLDDRVIGRVHMSVQREIAFAAAIICVVSVRCYDPVLQNKYSYRSSISTRQTTSADDRVAHDCIKYAYYYASSRNLPATSGP